MHVDQKPKTQNQIGVKRELRSSFLQRVKLPIVQYIARNPRVLLIFARLPPSPAKSRVRLLQLVVWGPKYCNRICAIAGFIWLALDLNVCLLSTMLPPNLRYAVQAFYEFHVRLLPFVVCCAGFYCPSGTVTSDPFRNDTTLRPYPCSPGSYCLGGVGYSEVRSGDYLYAQMCPAGFFCETAR